MEGRGVRGAMLPRDHRILHSLKEGFAIRMPPFPKGGPEEWARVRSGVCKEIAGAMGPREYVSWGLPS